MKGFDLTLLSMSLVEPGFSNVWSQMQHLRRRHQHTNAQRFNLLLPTPNWDLWGSYLSMFAQLGATDISQA